MNHPIDTNSSSSSQFIDRIMILTLAVMVVKTALLAPFWPLCLLTVVVCFSALAFPSLRTKSSMWFILSATLGMTVLTHWEDADNHRYLFCYWALALGMINTLPSSQQRQGLRIASAVMIGLCMGFATYWKAVSVDYLDGSFFEYTILTDDRFDFFTRGVANVSEQLLHDNRKLESLLYAGYLRGISLSSITLTSTSGIEWLASALTWWTILIEGLLAVLFLLPGSRVISYVRNSAMIFFAVSTYAVATVIGFAWMLLLMGLAQCRDDEVVFQRLYLLTFLLVLAYSQIPIGQILDAAALIR